MGWGGVGSWTLDGMGWDGMDPEGMGQGTTGRVKGNITNKNVQGNHWVCYSTISFVLKYHVLKMSGIRNRKKESVKKKMRKILF